MEVRLLLLSSFVCEVHEPEQSCWNWNNFGERSIGRLAQPREGQRDFVTYAKRLTNRPANSLPLSQKIRRDTPRVAARALSTRTTAADPNLWPDFTAKGELGVGQALRFESILGTQFGGKIVEETRLGPHPAIIPEIEGRAYLTGRHEFMIDPDDQLKEGFLLG